MSTYRILPITFVVRLPLVWDAVYWALFMVLSLPQLLVAIAKFNALIQMLIRRLASLVVNVFNKVNLALGAF